MDKKVIFVDWNIYVFRSIFSWARDKKIPATWKALNSLLADLKYLNISPDDIIILAVDSPLGSWRRDIDSNYKADRKGKREARTDINWKEMFSNFNELLDNINKSTPFHIVQIDKLEADDIIAQGIKYYNVRECIIVSSDSDYEQLMAFNNVKLFSPYSKKFKIVKDPYKLLAKKIKKETTDNLTTEISTEYDYNKRKMLVNLMNLPDTVVSRVNIVLSRLNEKDYDLSTLKFAKLRSKLMDIFNQSSDKMKTCGTCSEFLGDNVKCKKNIYTTNYSRCGFIKDNGNGKMVKYSLYRKKRVLKNKENISCLDI